MKNRELQEERVRGYFVQAASEILRGEGISNLSVRNVADKAGYSYATLYNYFKGLDELLSVCIIDFLAECKKIINTEVKDILSGKTRLQATINAYVKYFIQYPGIFELFYITPLKSSKSTELIVGFLKEICEDDWESIMREQVHNTIKIEDKQETINYLITGLLLLYNNRRYPTDYATFQDTMNAQIDKVLRNE